MAVHSHGKGKVEGSIPSASFKAEVFVELLPQTSFVMVDRESTQDELDEATYEFVSSHFIDSHVDDFGPPIFVYARGSDVQYRMPTLLELETARAKLLKYLETGSSCKVHSIICIDQKGYPYDNRRCYVCSACLESI